MKPPHDSESAHRRPAHAPESGPADLPLPIYARLVPAGIELRLKVVPGASRSGVAGVLGDRLKLRVAAPPSEGLANRAVLELLERRFGCPATIIHGAASAEKTALLAGPTAWRPAWDVSAG
jgi:uncharacterized protein (TIGR00251 family)